MNLEKLSKKELYQLARKKNIKNRSTMTKIKLIEALKMETLSEESEDKNVSSSYTEVIKKEPSKETKEVGIEEKYSIPESYDVDSLVLMPVDPSTSFCYWYISANTNDEYKEYLSESNGKYNIKMFTTSEGFSIEIQDINVDNSGNYYFHHYLAGKVVWAEIGVINPNGEFLPILSSKKVTMPNDRLSDVTDETFMTVKEHYSEILKLSGIQDKTHPGSLEFHKALLDHMLKSVSSKNISKRS